MITSRTAARALQTLAVLGVIGLAVAGCGKKNNNAETASDTGLAASDTTGAMAASDTTGLAASDTSLPASDATGSMAASSAPAG